MQLLDLFFSAMLSIAPILLGGPLVLSFFGALTGFGRKDARTGWRFVGLGAGWLLCSSIAAAAFFGLGMAHCCHTEVRLALTAISIIYLVLTFLLVRYQIRQLR